MNQIVEQKAPLSAITISTGQTGSKIAPRDMAEVIKFGELMARAGTAVPRHLRENIGACMRITLQALEWEMSPFALADKTYIVNDRIAYEAQLIAAVVNTRSGIKGRLKYSYEGTGPSLQCTVTGILDDEEYAYTSPRFDQITTKNSPLWKTDPQQQLGYYAARSWARRYTPEVILGVYDREEAEEFRGPDNARDITPAMPSVVERLRAAQEPQDAQEGFSHVFVHGETETLLTGQIRPEEDLFPDAAVSQTAEQDAGGDALAPTTSPASDPFEFNVEKLKFVFRRLYSAVGPDKQIIKTIAGELRDELATESEATRRKATVIRDQCLMLCSREIDKGEMVEYLAGVVGVEPKELLEGAIEPAEF